MQIESSARTHVGKCIYQVTLCGLLSERPALYVHILPDRCFILKNTLTAFKSAFCNALHQSSTLMGVLNGKFLYRDLEQSRYFYPNRLTLRSRQVVPFISSCIMCSLGIKHKTLALLVMLHCLSYRNVMAINVMHIINDNK